MEFCLPAEALATTGDQGQVGGPCVGESVAFSVEGTVTRTHGGGIYVKPTKINTVSLDGPSTDANAHKEFPSRDELLAELQQADGNLS